MRASCAAELIAPTSVFLSSGSPTRSWSTRRTRRRRTSSATDSWTRRREPAQQTWPWLKKMPSMMPSIISSTGASSKTMLAPLPPSSRVRCLWLAATRCWISPTDLGRAGEGDLVDVGVLDQRRARRAVAGDDVDDPGRQLRLLEDLGQDAAPMRGVVSAGFSTQVLPAARAGANFHAAISRGKFQGMIWPATPRGRGSARSPA